MSWGRGRSLWRACGRERKQQKDDDGSFLFGNTPRGFDIRFKLFAGEANENGKTWDISSERERERERAKAGGRTGLLPPYSINIT